MYQRMVTFQRSLTRTILFHTGNDALQIAVPREQHEGSIRPLDVAVVVGRGGGTRLVRCLARTL